MIQVQLQLRRSRLSAPSGPATPKLDGEAFFPKAEIATVPAGFVDEPKTLRKEPLPSVHAENSCKRWYDGVGLTTVNF